VTALDDLHRRSESTASGWRLLLYAIVLMPLGIAVVPLMLGRALPTALHIAVRAGLAVGLAALLYSVWLRGRVRQRLEASDLAQRIAAGGLLDDPIFQLTPWPWRMLLPGSHNRGSLASGLARVAANLDWYLNRPERLWRACWFYEPLLVLALAAFAVLTLQLRGVYLVFTAYPLFAIACILLLLPLPFLKFRRQLWTEELVRYLRAALDSDG
jgi:hypothetical protein